MSLFLLFGDLLLLVGLVGMGWLLWQVLVQQGRLLLRLAAVEARPEAAGKAPPASRGPGTELEAVQPVATFPLIREPGEIFQVQALSPGQKVFGIGLSKTGTGSLTEALKLLGYRAYHWPADLVTQVEVYRFFATGEVDIHLSILNDYDALTDTPVCCLYQALDKAYPGSKFILTVREKQAWLRSYHDHWRRYPPLFSEKPNSLVAHYSHFLNERLYGTQSADPQILSPAYDRYTAEVLEYFRERPHDLLILDICGGDGWSKLAPFLGVATPEVPFPWENQARNTMAQDDGKCETSDSTQRQAQEV